MRCIIFSASTINQTENNLFNVDVFYWESSLDEFRVEPMKSASGRKESRIIVMIYEQWIIRSSRDFLKDLAQ